jgi:hypothetical protein
MSVPAAESLRKQERLALHRRQKRLVHEVFGVLLFCFMIGITLLHRGPLCLERGGTLKSCQQSIGGEATERGAHEDLEGRCRSLPAQYPKKSARALSWQVKTRVSDPV